jgi:L-seryl-tRNA(Ser) seleniumtransferase
VHDVGSGLLADRPEPWLAGEPSMGGSLAAGADLVLCSGDKLLGGPQAGILAGRHDLVAVCRRHPLARALRLDKLRIAALVATVELHLRDDLDAIPTWRMLHAPLPDIEARAAALARRVGGVVEDGASLVGGGSAPDRTVPTRVVRLDSADADRLARALRTGDPPIVVRVERDGVLIDPRTLDPADDDTVADRIRAHLPTGEDAPA